MKGDPYVPKKQAELDNPFDRGDGYVYFTSGGNLIRVRQKRWQVVAQFKERINSVCAERGKIACVGNKGILHRYDGKDWTKTKLGFDSAVAVCRLADGRYACCGLEGEVAIVDGEKITRVDLGKAITCCAAATNGVWIGGDGVYFFDGTQYERELDVHVQSLLVVGDEVYAGGAQVGLSGKAQLWRRKKPTVWETAPAPASTTEHDFFSMVWWHDSIWIGNVVQLARYVPGDEVEVVSDEGVSRYVGVANDRLIVCATGEARSYDGGAFVSLI